MSKKEKLLLKLLTGNADANFDISELILILKWLEFEERNTGGSHQIFWKEGIEGIINLQKNKDGNAKSYQVKQVRTFLVTHKLIKDE